MLDNLEQTLGIKKKAGVLHIHIHNKLKAANSNTLKRKEALLIISRHMNKSCSQKFLEELKDCGLIKQINRDIIKIVE